MLRIRSVAAVLGLCMQIAAQPVPTVESAPTLRITVTLVQVDVVVTDSRGQRVTDLTAEDFQIFQDGKPQPVRTFLWNPAPRAVVRPQPGRGDRVPDQAPAPLTAAQIQRTVALVVDDLSLSFENIARTRDALKKFIERQMQPGDLVAIVRTGGGVVALEQFTTDRRILLSAVDLLKWRFNGRCGMNPIAPLPGQQSDGATVRPQLLDYGCSYAALGTIGTVEHVIRGMQRMPGRKSVVLLSNSLRVPFELHSAMDHLTDLANRSAVSVYSVDPEGLKTGEDRDERLEGGEPSGTLGGLLSDRAEEARGMEDGLRFLAARTGGLFYGNNNDIASCIRQATDDQLGYYLLGYTPEEGTFEPESPGKPRFHKITVRVRRPGLRVRWKSGFSGVPDTVRLAELDSVKKTREQQLADALSSPFTAGGVRVRLTSMFTHLGKEGGPAVRSLLHFDGRDLHFTKESDGTWLAEVDVVSVVFRGLKQTFLQSDRPQQIRLPESLYQQAMREGFLLFLRDVPMKEPGPFILRAVVRDRRSERIGSASQFLNVPDTRKGRLAMTSLNLKLATPAVMKAMASGQQDEEEEPGNAGAVADGGPAVRRYRPGQNILYGFMVLNPKLKGSDKVASVFSELRVYRDGKLIYTGKPTPLPENNRLDEQRHVSGGILQLGAKMTPGEYLLQLIVTDRGVRRSKGQVAQWIDFEVVSPDVRAGAR